MRAFFRMDYTGKEDRGAGSLALVDGKLAGLDVGGGIYTGHYREEGGKVVGLASVSFPQGGRLVTGAVVPAGAPPLNVPFEISEAEAAGGQVFRVQTPTGPVNVRLTKLADL